MTRRNLLLVGVALIGIVFIAVVLSQFASGSPDGLEFVAEREGFADAATESADHFLADYGGDSRTFLAVAGILGVVVTLGVGFGLFWLVRRDQPAG